ncbi:MAG: DNA-formamidopyrimidine glycosylase family protein [Gammaproteobacteria bacterium]|nr:DNA-formamidopyrimidine glycosylase family protein [Gammaproteobacteria bacterium]
MPELPDITVYIDALEQRVLDSHFRGAELRSPFLLRTVEPTLDSLVGQRVTALRRLAKRIAIGFEHGPWLVLHLMIAGRLHWYPADAKPRKTKQTAALFQFDTGTLTLTEAGTKKRASLMVVADDAALAACMPPGLEPLHCTPDEFGAALRAENHTLKRSLTDQRIIAGIGNAYSDEILHRARLAPLTMSQKLADDEIARLHAAMQVVLAEWTERLGGDRDGDFPETVTAFRDGMAVHGRYGEPCPDCGAPVQRIRYASNETNYCAACQNDGRIYADRALSRLLKKDFPRRLEDLE